MTKKEHVPLIPFDRFVIESPLAPGRAAAELASNVEPKRWIRFRRGPSAFEGEVTETDFRISRMIGYNNAFLPQIHGGFERSPHGTRVSGTMRLHPLVLVFIAVWSGMAILIGFFNLQDGPLTPLSFAPVGMIALVWAVVCGVFTVEARIARRRLAKILETR